MQRSFFKLLLFFVYYNVFTNLCAITGDSCTTNGLRLMQMQKYSEAIRQFDLCLEDEPAPAQLYFHRGTAYLLLHKPGIAMVDFNMALRLDSGIYEAYYNRGLAHQALGNYTFAEADFLLYHARVSGDKKVLMSLAMLMETMQDYPGAIEYYGKFLRLLPDTASHPALVKDYRDALIARALASAEIDSLSDAIQDLNTCLEAHHNDTAVWMVKGNIYYDARQYSEAIDAYNVILLLYPQFKSALINRADAYTASGRYEEALRDYQLLSSTDKYNADYYFNAGFCFLQMKKSEDAVLSFGKAMDTEYTNLGLLLTLRGVAYNNMNMLQEACADWGKAKQAGYGEAETYIKNYCR